MGLHLSRLKLGRGLMRYIWNLGRGRARISQRELRYLAGLLRNLAILF